MNNIQIFTVTILLSSTVAFSAGRKSVPLVPLNGTPVTVIINEKEKQYYGIAHQSPLKLQLDGPGKLTIMSRLRLPKNSADVEKYTIRVVEEKKALKIQTTQTDKSEAEIKSSDDVAGKSRKFSMNVPEGSFTYEFWLDDTPRDALVRFTMEPSKEKRSLVAIEPLSYDKIVTAKINESLVAYYVASKERPVQLRVVGPTQLEVMARLNYDVRMNGDQKYQLTIQEGQKLIAQKLLQTSKSVGLSYEDWREVVPGKPNKFSLTVPQGEHTYRYSFGESIALSVSLKFSLPAKDLNNEK